MNKIVIEPNIEALIFDCDGTLVDSMPLHMRAWKEAFKNAGVYFNEEYLFSLKGMKETEIVSSYNKKFGTKLHPESFVDLKHQYFIRHIETVKPIEPIAGLAHNYSGKLPIAVVSGSVGNIVRKELEVTSLLNLFDKILTADDPFRPKPSPDIFLAAAQYLKCSPENCIVFEDGDSGLEGAANAGMKSVDVREYT